ncbi:hypothetical protein HID58_013472, partial [Brassica napus]
YESTPVVPPNDEYVSEDELDEACTDSDSETDSNSSLSLSMMAPSTGIPNESRRRPRPRPTELQLPGMRQGRPQITLSDPSAMAPSFSPPGVVPPGAVPPRAVPHASVGSSSAVPVAPAPYVRRREDALLRAPSRRNQPHLHPDKTNGALWFGIDPEGNYWGSWASWNFVPPEKKDQWWHAFIQHYYWDDQFHDEIYLKWKKQTQVTVCGRISQNRRDNRQPSYMSDAHWATMVEKYSTEQAKRKTAKPAKSRKSAPVGKKMHKHGASPRCFLNIAYQMMVDEGLDEPPSYTALARKTHTGKDGSFLDERTEELVLEVEEAVEEMLQDGSPLGDSQTDSTAASNAKRYLLNQEYIKRGKTKKSTIYGLGSVQYKNSSPSVPIPVSLQRNLDVDMEASPLRKGNPTEEEGPRVKFAKTGSGENVEKTTTEEGKTRAVEIVESTAKTTDESTAKTTDESTAKTTDVSMEMTQTMDGSTEKTRKDSSENTAEMTEPFNVVAEAAPTTLNKGPGDEENEETASGDEENEETALEMKRMRKPLLEMNSEEEQENPDGENESSNQDHEDSEEEPPDGENEVNARSEEEQANGEGEEEANENGNPPEPHLVKRTLKLMRTVDKKVDQLDGRLTPLEEFVKEAQAKACFEGRNQCFQPQAPIQSQHQPQDQGQSTALPQHLTINNPSELDRWCQDLGM